MRPDEMSGREGGHKTELASQHCAAHDPGELGGVLPRAGGVGALHPQHLQAGSLGRQYCTATNRPHLN